MNHLWRSLKEMIIHIGIILLNLFLPNKIKRIVYLTTLHARLVHDGVFQQELLSKVNQTLLIARDDKALILPATMGHRLWTDEQIRPLFNNASLNQVVCLPFDEATRISKELVEMSPDWLRYAKSQEMVIDTLKLFYCQPVGNSSNTQRIALG